MKSLRGRTWWYGIRSGSHIIRAWRIGLLCEFISILRALRGREADGGRDVRRGKWLSRSCRSAWLLFIDYSMMIMMIE